jgi:cytochrome c oxidase cbb3-type subunit 3
MDHNDIERDKLFDHDYDGIMEYDNPMPKWWVYLFVASIIYSVAYFAWFHSGDDALQHERGIYGALDAEIAAYAQQLMATYGELEPDQQTILSYMENDVAMKGMAGLFKGKCAQCHNADGSGQVGSNLTDDYWINVTEVTDIAEVLTNGRVAKGMPAWGDQLTSTEIVLLSSYVASLRENPVPGKAPEPNAKQIPPWPEPEPQDAAGSDDASGAPV